MKACVLIILETFSPQWFVNTWSVFGGMSDPDGRMLGDPQGNVGYIQWSVASHKGLNTKEI